MDIFGIGPLEFVLILVLALILLGPKGMVETAQKTGSFIKQIVQSEGWRNIVKSTREIRQAQDKILQETGLQETLDELRDTRFIQNSISMDLPERPQPNDGQKDKPENIKSSSITNTDNE